MGGCCGAMKTGQKSLPENKQQKIDSENKQNEKEAIANTNNTVEACNDKGEKVQLNHCETSASPDINHDTPHDVANGLDQHALTSSTVPATAAAPGTGEGLSAEEEVATKIVTQAMEAALAETNGGTLDHQTSVAGSGVSEDEALNEWMKADTRNALVIDEPESAAQVEQVSAAAILPAFAAPEDIEVTVEKDLNQDAPPEVSLNLLGLSTEDAPVEEQYKTSRVEEEVEQSLSEDLSTPVSRIPEPPLEQEVSQSIAPSEEAGFVSEPVVPTEPRINKELDASIPTETPQNIALTELSGQRLETLEVEPLSAEVSCKLEEPVAEVAHSEPFDAAVTTPVANFDDEAVLNQENFSENQPVLDFAQPFETTPADISVTQESPQTLGESTDNFDSSILPPPPPHDLTDEPSVPSPDFPELPTFEQVPGPADCLTEQTIERRDLAEAANESESNSAIIRDADFDLNDLPSPPSATPLDLLEPEIIPVLEEVVEQAKEQREQWWKEGQSGVVPLVNGTNGTPDNDSTAEQLQAAASPDQESTPNNHVELSGEEHLELPSSIKVAAVPDDQVPSLETDENGVKQDSSTEATVSAQA